MSHSKKNTSPLLAGLCLRCPQCSKGKIYARFLKIAKKCAHCGFEIARHNAADGPAFFGITLVGISSSVLAALVEVKYAPPLWVHMALWVPFILLGTVFSLVLFKSLFIAVQFKFKVGNYNQTEKRHAKGKKPQKKPGKKKTRRA